MIAFISGMPGLAELFIIIIVTGGIVIIPFWKIFSRAGFHGALSLLMLIPFINLIMIFFLAFAQWPALKT